MTLTDVCFSYGEKVILDHFSLSLPDAGITALAGSSGCGKTTLLRLLGGLERPQSGVLEAPNAAETAFLFQEDRLLPGLTAAAQVAVVLSRGDDPLPWLKAVGLGDAADVRPEELSGGMRRRVALARCLAYGQSKQLLLLDEPFSGIDPERSQALMSLIRTLEIPVIYSAHDALSLSLADRVIRLAGPPLRFVS